ncbi:MAG TPA: DNA repair protein RecO [Kouleothrix sp.]|uniref:DNA repair protein RecO n=1 Tax=Kouleothrix sp. TaxID=2779161 RepID=UPI002CC946DC|nr:DNA repair protein RecO [Kouleothrix sp.]HRC75221.1 DNA repair protein RecO [Kouleothrix sp.]
MRERVYRTEAVIIRRSDFGEADRLVTLITPAGKRRVVAKGARKTTSRLAGHIELFTHATMLLAVGRTFDIITQSAIVHSFDALRADLERIGAAYYAAELIDRLIEEDDENRPAFDLLVATLGALDSTRAIDLVLRHYELRLLGFLGYRPQLYHCANCQETLTEEAGRFSALAGGVLCPRCAPHERSALAMSLSTFKLLRFLQAQPLDAVERLNISPATRAEAEQLLRAYIRRILERDLKSAAFLAEIRHT